MKLIPDVVGIDIEKAIELLNDLNIHVDKKVIKAPKCDINDGQCRVIKQINKENSIELIISYF